MIDPTTRALEDFLDALGEAMVDVDLLEEHAMPLRMQIRSTLAERDALAALITRVRELCSGRELEKRTYAESITAITDVVSGGALLDSPSTEERSDG